MDDLRKYLRAPLSVPVKFFNWDRPMEADALGISPEGIFLKTPQTLPEGSLLTLRLSLPGWAQAFTVLGKVVRTVQGSVLRPAGMGVRFIDISSPARAILSEYVAQRALPRAA